jgi:NADH:ubiquinone oxidoreductase subunit F (NADH-binding)
MPQWQVEEWLDTMAKTSICGLGQASPIPVRAAFRHWPELQR